MKQSSVDFQKGTVKTPTGMCAAKLAWIGVDGLLAGSSNADH